SAILSSILYSPKTLKAIDEKRVELIFVANIAVGKVIRKVLKRKFPESLGTESYLMYGDQKDEKKDAIIDRLKESGKTKFGILSIESGSTGFSIPDAYVTIMQTLSYNVATELQAIGRMDRATSKGDKYVVYPRFGIFSEAHIPVVQEIKKLTFKNFFSPAETQLERLQDIALLIRHNIYQSFLNEKREADAASKEMEEIDAITESLTSGIEEADLEAFVQMLTPELPEIPLPPARVAAVAQATLNPPLRIKGNKLFKLPLPNSLSQEDKVRLASYIEQNRKAAKAYQLLLNLIDEAKRSVRSIEDIGVDRFKIDGQDYVLELKDHPDRIKRVKIVSSANGSFEILI
ncbi:MAG: C-terminal helicase domain-containing protein, partial [Parachlamydiaceae bacterium]